MRIKIDQSADQLYQSLRRARHIKGMNTKISPQLGTYNSIVGRGQQDRRLWIMVPHFNRQAYGLALTLDGLTYDQTGQERRPVLDKMARRRVFHGADDVKTHLFEFGNRFSQDRRVWIDYLNAHDHLREYWFDINVMNIVWITRASQSQL